jgi:hypothetical protein
MSVDVLSLSLIMSFRFLDFSRNMFSCAAYCYPPPAYSWSHSVSVTHRAPSVEPPRGGHRRDPTPNFDGTCFRLPAALHGRLSHVNSAVVASFASPSRAAGAAPPQRCDHVPPPPAAAPPCGAGRGHHRRCHRRRALALSIFRPSVLCLVCPLPHTSSLPSRHFFILLFFCCFYFSRVVVFTLYPRVSSRALWWRPLRRSNHLRRRCHSSGQRCSGMGPT